MFIVEHTSTKKIMNKRWTIYGRKANKKLRILAYLSHNPKFHRVELTPVKGNCRMLQDAVSRVFMWHFACYMIACYCAELLKKHN